MNGSRLGRGRVGTLLLGLWPIVQSLAGATTTVDFCDSAVVNLTGSANLLNAYPFALMGLGGGIGPGLAPSATGYDFGQTISSPVVSPSAEALQGTVDFHTVRWSVTTDSPADVSNQIRLTAHTVGLASGEKHTLLLKRDGTVTAVGTKLQSGQAVVPANLANVVAVAAGSDHSLALRADGSVVAWGWNGAGQTDVPRELEKVVAIAAGRDYSLALRADGTVRAWGGALPGSMYDAHEGGAFEPPEALEEPSPPVPPYLRVVAIAAGLRHCLALRMDGSVIGWGPASEKLAWSAPTNLGPVVAICAGKSFSLALKPDGSLRAWGDNRFHQLDVPPTATQVVAIAAGYYHALALREDRTVVVWGDNSAGQGVAPSGLTNVVAIAAGGFHSELLVQTQPTLINPHLSDGRFGCELNLPAGQYYRIEASRDLVSWGSVEVDRARPGWLYWQGAAAALGTSFYRVQPWWPRSREDLGGLLQGYSLRALVCQRAERGRAHGDAE